ncbi:hypothetical protein T265_11639 [Opisthorchis viverrini]|uniref:Uncharacterized protein n=1 Tax=Opisthorchis viverrini TaxID=6198 RepID=A0A074Z2B5_OPIVI|nr:hypothetical protein T265_11639 [Opisthorchis viverrini]KER19642.1 hypothetical protein T265_11639 [Opisthorchis viverrini]
MGGCSRQADRLTSLSLLKRLRQFVYKHFNTASVASEGDEPKGNVALSESLRNAGGPVDKLIHKLRSPTPSGHRAGSVLTAPKIYRCTVHLIRFSLQIITFHPNCDNGTSQSEEIHKSEVFSLREC